MTHPTQGQGKHIQSLGILLMIFKLLKTIHILFVLYPVVIVINVSVDVIYTNFIICNVILSTLPSLQGR